MNAVVALLALALLILGSAFADEDLAPPTVCAVPCPPPEAAGDWCYESASWVGACASMHAECSEWVMTHYGQDGAR